MNIRLPRCRASSIIKEGKRTLERVDDFDICGRSQLVKRSKEAHGRDQAG